MSLYSDQLAEEYAKNRKGYKATDGEVFSHIDKIGLTGKRVLDFGCGDGVYTEEFLRRGASEVVGIDESPKMIELAKKKFGDVAEFVVADGNVLPFKDRSFDFVFANFVLHHFPETLKPLQEIFRVLDTNGCLISTFGAYEIPAEANVILNIPAPIRLGVGENTTLVHNIVKSHRKVKEDFENAGFRLETYQAIDNPNARMDDTHPYKDKVTLMTMLAVAVKP